MSDESTKNQILDVWKAHAASVRKALDENGIVINTIDDSRAQAIEVVKIIIHNFQKGDFDVNDFRNALDSYNNHNNLWGFANKLGQMYFKQLIKAHEKSLSKLTNILKEVIQEPKNVRDALGKIDALEKLTETIYEKSKDKRNAPYPGAVGFFLSYFWQISNHQKWPILYNTLINSFRELGMWEEKSSQKEIYEQYYSVYNSIRKMLEAETDAKIGYWELEHVLWNYKASTIKPQELKPVEPKVAATAQATVEVKEEPVRPIEVAAEATVERQTAPSEIFEEVNVKEYLLPRLSQLLDHSSRQDEAKPENQFQTLVAEGFSQLEFHVEILDQSVEKNAFAILRFKSENVAFIVDAQAQADAFFKSTDRRIVKDYIHENCKILRREGFDKVGYMMVSDAFDMKHQAFVSYINWNTDIKKTCLLNTEAFLYLLAFKTKNRLGLMHLIDRIAAFPFMVDNTNIASLLGEK